MADRAAKRQRRLSTDDEDDSDADKISRYVVAVYPG
jgi:hypothetical protein